MNLEKLRARLVEIQAELTKFQGADNFSDEDLTKINAFNDEFETVTKQIEAAEKLEANLAKATASAGRKTNNNPAGTVQVKATKKEKNGGFNSFGEFLMSARGHQIGQHDRRFDNAMFTRQGEDGGFLIPEEMMSGISKKVSSDESLLGKSRSITISGNSLSIPTNEVEPWSGGIVAYWTAEGNPITTSKIKLGNASWKLNKLAALVPVTDELLEDSVALESFIQSEAPIAMNWKINKAIIQGTGVGQPKGILGSGFTITVPKESGQAADTVEARNVIKMWSRMVPDGRARAEWWINPAVEEQLRTMVDDQGNFIYLAPGSQMNQNPYGLLFGRPVIPMLGGMPELGDRGDIMLVDMAYYYTIVKRSGINQAISTHLYFDQDLTAYRFTFRLDGSCPFKAPITPEFGNYEMSGFVVLADRA